MLGRVLHMESEIRMRLIQQVESSRMIHFTKDLRNNIGGWTYSRYYVHCAFKLCYKIAGLAVPQPHRQEPMIQI